MAVSKNARVGSGTHKFNCPVCGSELQMNSRFAKGKMQHYCYCSKCDRSERRPSDFR